MEEYEFMSIDEITGEVLCKKNSKMSTLPSYIYIVEKGGNET